MNANIGAGARISRIDIVVLGDMTAWGSPSNIGAGSRDGSRGVEISVGCEASSGPSVSSGAWEGPGPIRAYATRRIKERWNVIEMERGAPRSPSRV